MISRKVLAFLLFSYSVWVELGQCFFCGLEKRWPNSFLNDMKKCEQIVFCGTEINGIKR